MQSAFCSPVVKSTSQAVSFLSAGDGGQCVERMSRFVEIACDSRQGEVVRQILMRGLCADLRHHFAGRIPSEAERIAFIESA